MSAAPSTSERWRALRLVERNVVSYRHTKLAIASGFLEPVFYLLALGFGVGTMVGSVEVDGRSVPYAAFVGPALIVGAAMNDAINDTTLRLFQKLRYDKVYDSILNTPLRVVDVAVGEAVWVAARATAYALAFVVLQLALGLLGPGGAVLVVVVSALVAFTSAACGVAIATIMRSTDDFEFIQLAVVPMFLLSATLYPLSVYPDWLARLITFTPLYQGVALARAGALGTLDISAVGHFAYLVMLSAVALSIASRRIRRLFHS
jgi:lipooligosaccharide transport system permease protein